MWLGARGGARIFVIFVGKRLGVRTSGEGVRGGPGPEGWGLESPWRSNLSQLPRSEVAEGWWFESLCVEACAGRKAGRLNLGGIVISGRGGAGRLRVGMDGVWAGQGVAWAGRGGQNILLCRLGGRSNVAPLTIVSALVHDGLPRWP